MFALILDDAELNNALMVAAMHGIPACEPVTFTVPAEALAFLAQHGDKVGVATTDYEMPEMNGVAFIRAARQLPAGAHLPIIMVTSMDQRALRREALDAGATDFLNKPFDAAEIKARVTNLLALSRARQAEANRAAWLKKEVEAATRVIEQREQEIISLLMKAAEHRDTDTGDHIARVASYVTIIAEALDCFDPPAIRRLALASTMHDVGKIAVPDAILLKPGPLTPEERREMEQHAERGRKILEGSRSEVVLLASELAASHHERWDGTGYPRGLAGEAIPLSGRIVAVADVFDALTSARPYKAAWPPEEARAFLEKNAGTHFDPACVAAFLRSWSKVMAVFTSCAVESERAPRPAESMAAH
ncbi:MAG TPA: HD domain-containing phosphohydrolase [Beijerinckiaceae bacterium]